MSFITVLEARSPRSGCQHGSVSSGLFQDISPNRRDEKVFQASFTRALIPFMWALPSWPSHFPIVPPPEIISLGIRFLNIWILEEHKHLDHGTQRGYWLVGGNPMPYATECSVVLIGSQGLRKLNKDQQPQVEGLRWQTPWWISQQYMSISRVFIDYQSLRNPPLLYMFLFEIWVNYWVLRQSTNSQTW